ncbi:MAG: LysR family transcriptional regulator [Clostridiales bacterium]|nr:LysR family transcriptional regulator [Clostridiales bacterium]
MNQQKITCFLAVARTLSFSKAARELYMSQSTVTYQIQSLERELKIALFCRSTTSVSLTDAGKMFLTDAEKLHETYQKIEQDMKRFRDKRPFTFAIPPTMILFCGSEFRALFQELEQMSDHPVRRIVIRDAMKSMMEVLEGRLDFMIMDTNFFQPWRKQLTITPLYRTGQMVILSVDHPLYAKEEIRLEDLVGETVFLSEEDPCFLPQVKNVLLYRGIPVTYQTMSSYQLLLPFIEMNQGISFTTIVFPVPERVGFRTVHLGVDSEISICSASVNPAPEIPLFADAVQRFFGNFSHEKY